MWEWLLALAAITFLPIGYIISVFSQTVYLNWRRYLGRIRGWLGFHGAAMDRIINAMHNIQGSEDEAVNEARTLLLTSMKNGVLDIETSRYMRDWISRRMDVVAINQSICCATLLAGIITLIPLWRFGQPTAAWLIPFITSILVGISMICSIIVLRRQIIEVIAGIYRTYGYGS